MLKIFLILPLLFALEGFAAEGGGGGYATLIYGLSVPDSANTTMHTVYGFTGGSQITSLLSIGGYHAVSSENDGPGNAPFSYSLTGLESRVNLVTGEKNVFIGLRAGIAKVNSSSTGTKVTFSPYHYGIVSGFNFKLWSIIYVGFEGSFIEIEDSSALSGATTINYQSFHNINFFGTLGIMF